MPNFTKQAIKASFLKLLNEQPLSRITVRSIVEDCGINRNSFYYHYQDIPTLIEEIIKEKVDTLVAKYPTINTLHDCVDLAFHFALQNKKAVLHIYNSVNRAMYEQYTMELCEYVITTYLNTAFGQEAISAYDHAIVVRMLKCELFGLLYEWIRNGMKDDAVQEIYRVADLCRGLSEELLCRIRAAEADRPTPPAV